MNDIGIYGYLSSLQSIHRRKHNSKSNHILQLHTNLIHLLSSGLILAHASCSTIVAADSALSLKEIIFSTIFPTLAV